MMLSPPSLETEEEEEGEEVSVVGMVLSLGRCRTVTWREVSGESGEGGKVWSLGGCWENWSDVSSSPGAHTLWNS